MIDVNDGMTPSKVNAAIQNSTLLSQLSIRKFVDFEDFSNDIVDVKKNESDSDFRNSFVDTAL